MVDPDEDETIKGRAFQSLLQSELKGVLVSRKISIDPQTDIRLETNMTVDYGNQALRYFVGFGAGAGSVDISVTLTKMPSKTVLYQNTTHATLAMGGFGGSMQTVVENAIKDAVQAFSNQLDNLPNEPISFEE